MVNVYLGAMVDKRASTGGNVPQDHDGAQGALTVALLERVEADRFRRGDFSPVHVQFRKRGLVDCATVLSAVVTQDGAHLFQLDGDLLGRCWASGQNVRLCDFDGRCTCAAAGQDAPRAAAPAAFAVPLGNTGTTTVEGA